MRGTLNDQSLIYLQIAQMLEDDILRGVYREEEQVPSTNELARGYNINPATAAKGINLLVADGVLGSSPIRHYVTGVSAGIVDDQPMLDLRYSEDSRAMVDLNCIMNDWGEIVELQGTGEGRAFTLDEQQELVRLCAKGNRELLAIQKQVLGGKF